MADVSCLRLSKIVETRRNGCSEWLLIGSDEYGTYRKIRLDAGSYAPLSTIGPRSEFVFFLNEFGHKRLIQCIQLDKTAKAVYVTTRLTTKYQAMVQDTVGGRSFELMCALNFEIYKRVKFANSVKPVYLTEVVWSDNKPELRLLINNHWVELKQVEPGYWLMPPGYFDLSGSPLLAISYENANLLYLESRDGGCLLDGNPIHRDQNTYLRLDQPRKIVLRVPA